jgi:hypothetical protein
VAILGEGDNVLYEIAAFFDKVSFDMEFFFGIDLEIATRAVHWLSRMWFICENVNMTLSIRITPIEMSVCIWLVASMFDCSVSVNICLHDVELWTVVSTDLAGVTVVHSIF